MGPKSGKPAKKGEEKKYSLASLHSDSVVTDGRLVAVEDTVSRHDDRLEQQEEQLNMVLAVVQSMQEDGGKASGKSKGLTLKESGVYYPPHRRNDTPQPYSGASGGGRTPSVALASGGRTTAGKVSEAPKTYTYSQPPKVGGWRSDPAYNTGAYGSSAQSTSAAYNLFPQYFKTPPAPSSLDSMATPSRLARSNDALGSRKRPRALKQAYTEAGVGQHSSQQTSTREAQPSSVSQSTARQTSLMNRQGVMDRQGVPPSPARQDTQPPPLVRRDSVSQPPPLVRRDSVSQPPPLVRQESVSQPPSLVRPHSATNAAPPVPLRQSSSRQPPPLPRPNINPIGSGNTYPLYDNGATVRKQGSVKMYVYGMSEGGCICIFRPSPPDGMLRIDNRAIQKAVQAQMSSLQVNGVSAHLVALPAADQEWNVLRFSRAARIVALNFVLDIIRPELNNRPLFLLKPIPEKVDHSYLLTLNRCPEPVRTVGIWVTRWLGMGGLEAQDRQRVVQAMLDGIRTSLTPLLNGYPQPEFFPPPQEGSIKEEPEPED